MVRKPETIVFLHGWGSEHSVLKQSFQYLFATCRCVFVDLLGFGKSDIPKKAYSVPMQAETIESLCNYLEIKHFSIISHSYGGRISIFLLSKENSRVKRAILLAPAGVPSKKTLGKAVKLAIFKIKKRITKEKNKHKLQKYYSSDFQSANAVQREMLYLAINYNQKKQLDKIYQNVLLIRGKEDTAVTKNMVKTMAKCMKNAELLEISGGHFAFLENAVAVKLQVENFLLST